MARFVSGYLHIPASEIVASVRPVGGNTPAWIRVFLPSGGWAEFDPTKDLVGNRDLVRDPIQARPLSGTWSGAVDGYLGMDVEVDVTAEKPAGVTRRYAGGRSARGI